MVNLAELPPGYGSERKSRSQSAMALLGSWVSASRQIYRSVSERVCVQAWLRAPGFLW
jgi:hypothetical protein